MSRSLQSAEAPRAAVIATSADGVRRAASGSRGSPRSRRRHARAAATRAAATRRSRRVRSAGTRRPRAANTAISALSSNSRPRAARSVHLPARVEARAQRGMRGRQQHGQVGEALRKVLPRGRRDERRGAIPVDRRRDEALARHPQVRAGRRALTGQHQIEMMQRQLREQRIVLAFVAQQPQRGRIQHGARARARRAWRCRPRGRPRAARSAGWPPRALRRGSAVPSRRSPPRAQTRPPASVIVTPRPAGRNNWCPSAFELAHLRADGLHGHVEPRGRAREAAFLHDDPEVVQMSEIEHRSEISENRTKIQILSDFSEVRGGL